MPEDERKGHGDAPETGFARSRDMTETPDDLRRRMEAAAASLDYETARRLRDRLNLMRGGADGADAAEADTAGLTRQQPGRMGLGTSQQRTAPPPGWRPPLKPDPMTTGTARPRGRRQAGPP